MPHASITFFFFSFIFSISRHLGFSRTHLKACSYLCPFICMQIQSNKSASWPDEQSELGQKTRLIISLSRFRFPLPSTYTSVCKARVANPCRSDTIRASLTLARLATAWPFSWLTKWSYHEGKDAKRGQLGPCARRFLKLPVSNLH